MSRDVRDGVDESDESDEEDERWDEDDAMRWCEDEELTDAEEETRETSDDVDALLRRRRADATTGTRETTRETGDGSKSKVPAALSYGSVFTHAKAGMEAVDRELISRVVYDATVGTPHHENELRKEAKTSKRIASMKEKARQMTRAEWETCERRSDERARMMEKTRDARRKWLVVDMDGFYAACEELANPELKKVPVGVASGPSCVLTTANYVARK